VLIIRVGVALDTHADEIAGVVAERIRAHPLAPHLSGTVLIGTGGGRLIAAGDPYPRVIIPLPGSHALSVLAIAQVKRCDGVVVRDSAEAGRLAQIIGTAQVVVADNPRGTPRAPFLTGADAAQTTAAWDAVDENPELRDSLSTAGRRRVGASADQHAIVADAAIEAIVACGPDAPASFPPATRG